MEQPSKFGTPVPIQAMMEYILCSAFHLFLLGTHSKKIRDYLETFLNMGGGLPNSQNFCKLTKCFFVCQIHSEVLKHVLQRGGGDI